MTGILSEILREKRQFVARLQANLCVRDFQDQALAIRARAKPHALLEVLASNPHGINIIAEFKRRSPSAGMIRADLSATDIVRCYERGGACAISVLTDEQYFGGSIVDLTAIRAVTALPILRKDFIVDEIQIYEAAANGADAVLLIAAALDDTSLAELRAAAEDELGLDTIIEVHTSEELRRAVNAGATIIGVNNRDLRTFRTSVETSEGLIAEAPRDRIMISESGLHDPQSLRHLRTLGFRGFLIGEALMRAPNPEAAIRDLINGAQDQRFLQMSCSRRSVTDPLVFPAARRARTTTDRCNPIRIKICGITNPTEAGMCIELGADMIGFNFYRKSPRYVEPAKVRDIVEALAVENCAVGVFVDADPAEIRKVAKAAGISTVQLHGDATPESCNELAQEFRVIRAFSTDTRFRPEYAGAFPNCDSLVDAYHPQLRGGTGQTCDWIAAREALRYARFLILSGGLNARNVRAAIATVMPHAVDVCSGIESAPGVKDYRALEQFIGAVRTAGRVASAHNPASILSPDPSEGSRML
jgi:indole-3-glycerol phosphate synthase / phosphoribosylanthranilate isomerase